LGNCKGPCEALQSEEDYDENIRQIKNILKGNLGEVIQHFKNVMKGWPAHWNLKRQNRYGKKSTISKITSRGLLW
jgi:excinuclease ABC subunit C